ncbi:hypothetical protein KFL_005850040 [Klebsormidium nitens]|uniref:Uncharacterized protein n=1 Tax=Klebsormidium nitens TaxID=105231 RepID=A0A1Y1IGJ6_KLENI|nr:hypothetical protein KFL_005850040 [Klebsormidium nitens]|eukprot:GAQ89980.1 hypothetical protein KFL_005850040 [Klebsormidium nitens]
MRQACRVAKDKAAALRCYCIEAGLLKLPVRAKVGKTRQACPKDVNRKRRSLEASLQKLFAKGRANGAGVEEFVWGISYGDGSIRIDLTTLLSKHLTVPERKAAVTSLGPVCSPPMAVTSFTAAFGPASGRLAWWPPVVPLLKAWKLKAEETIAVLEAMARNIVTHFGAGTTMSEEEQKRGCLEVFKRCVVGAHVAAGLKGSDSQKVAIFELIGEKALMTWQLPEASGQGQEGCDSGALRQPPAPRRVRRTKAQMGPQPFPCPHCIGEYSTAAAVRAHRCKARSGAQPNTESPETEAPAPEGAHHGRGASPSSNGGEGDHWDDGPDGALDELIEEVERDGAQGTAVSEGTVLAQPAAAEFLQAVQAFAAPFEQDANAPFHLLKLLKDLLDKGDVGRDFLYVLHTMQGVGTVSTRLLKAGLGLAVPTDTLLIEAHTEVVVKYLRPGSGNWPKFVEQCELLEDLAENMGGELAERWSCFQRAIINPLLASELVVRFNQESFFGNLRAFVERANGALQGHQRLGQHGVAPSVQHEKGQRDGAPSAQPDGGQPEKASSPKTVGGQPDKTPSAKAGVAPSIRAFSTQPGGGGADKASSPIPGGGPITARGPLDKRPSAQHGGAPGERRGGAPGERAPGTQPGGGRPDKASGPNPAGGPPEKMPSAQLGGKPCIGERDVSAMSGWGISVVREGKLVEERSQGPGLPNQVAQRKGAVLKTCQVESEVRSHG